MSREDIEKDLNQILLEKMTKEYDDFIEKLSMQSPDEIIRASYEKVFKEDILAVVESRDCLRFLYCGGTDGDACDNNLPCG